MEGKISRLDNLGEQEIEETGDENYMEAYGTTCILLLAAVYYLRACVA